MEMIEGVRQNKSHHRVRHTRISLDALVSQNSNYYFFTLQAQTMLEFRQMDIAHLRIEADFIKDQIKPFQAKLAQLEDEIKKYTDDAHSLQTFVDYSMEDKKIEQELLVAVKNIDKSYCDRARAVEEDRAEIDRMRGEMLVRLDDEQLRIQTKKLLNDDKLIGLKNLNDKYHDERQKRDAEQEVFELEKLAQIEDIM
jgi:hypothetical protein